MWAHLGCSFMEFDNVASICQIYKYFVYILAIQSIFKLIPTVHINLRRSLFYYIRGPYIDSVGYVSYKLSIYVFVLKEVALNCHAKYILLIFIGIPILKIWFSVHPNVNIHYKHTIYSETRLWEGVRFVLLCECNRKWSYQ